MLINYKRIGDYKFVTSCFYPKKINGFKVPCGKCPRCLAARARDLAYRCEIESEDTFVYNVLLTYDDYFVPRYKGKLSLNRVHIDLFMKRLRFWFKKTYGIRVKYILCGEYGGNTHRPHYHLLLFCPVCLSKNHKSLERLEAIFANSWKYGFVSFKPFEGNSIGKMVRYMVQYMFISDGRQYDYFNRPFVSLSRRPAIGIAWFERNKNFIAKCNEELKYTRPIKVSETETIQVALPRYYVKKMRPESIQIAFADAYYYHCKEYENYLKTLSYGAKTKLAAFIEKCKERERKEYRDKYRLRKVHSNDSSASKVFKRNTQTGCSDSF